MAEYAPKYCELADESPSYGRVAWIMNDTSDLTTLAACNSGTDIQMNIDAGGVMTSIENLGKAVAIDNGKSACTLCNHVVPHTDTDLCFGAFDINRD